MIKRLLQGLACALLLAAWGSVAIAADWKISQLTGEAWILTEGMDPVPAASGLVVPKGSTVSTGQNDRVMLVHDQDTVLVGPNSLVGVPYRPDRGVSTTLVQQVGEVELAVQKRGRPHFSVQTPFLAAVVKGTEFSVLVSEQDATVRVHGGLVAVQDLRSGERADIGAGQAATAARGGAGLSVSGTGAVPEIRAGRRQKPTVPALGSVANPDDDNGTGNNGNGNANNGNRGYGNGNGASDGSNAGGNGNGNNGNAGGNGNGNPGGNGNGNGNGCRHGDGCGNGNGNGNLGGNGNGPGGNGSGPGGNGNVGGNGNGNGNGRGTGPAPAAIFRG